MGRGPDWEDHEYDLLKVLIDEGLTNHEIAEIIDRPYASIVIKAQKKFGGNPNYQKRITKHAHLREDVMQYYQSHTFEETVRKFDLTQSEMKSLLTVSYKSPGLAHLRKDKRTHNKWTVDELLFLLRHAGLQQRGWIARKIKRGNSRVIKEKLMNLGVNTKTLNGMTLSRYRLVFQCEPRRSIEGSAGPTRGCMPTFFKIVPWVDVERDIQSGRVSAPQGFVAVAEIMARFQRWIHGDQAVRSLKRAAGRGHAPPNVTRTFLAK